VIAGLEVALEDRPCIAVRVPEPEAAAIRGFAGNDGLKTLPMVHDLYTH
jgi:hypothetical protein